MARQESMGGGFGGSGKGGGKGSAKNDSNTLQANSTAQVLFLLGEGRIKGVVDGAKNLILDETRVMNADGKLNIKGVQLHLRTGFPTQTPITAFDGVANEIPVGVKVEKATPITRSLTDQDYTSVNVTIRVPALVKQTDDGMKKSTVQFKIEVSYDGGPKQMINGGPITIEGKNVAPYDVQFLTALPRAPSGNSHPWDVTVTRITDDSNSDKLQNDIYFGSMTGIIDVTLQYPDSALMGLLLDAKQFDNSLPDIGVIVDGLYIQVPSNYDPETRVYTGVWDGTFKSAFCNNPAWVYRTIAIHKRFGIGQFMDTSAVDKWTLYTIAQVCDEAMPDGYGGTEPRFAINAYIKDAREAYEVMQLIASAFRGMSYWSSGAVTASQDTLSSPKVLVTRANVIGGEFNYSSSSLTARHTVAHVKYSDARDDYQDAVEVVRNIEGMRRYGERIKEVTAFGCTSRAGARRLGEWILQTELNETMMLGYQAGLDHASRRPGDIINVMDPEISNLDFGGRTVAATTTSLTIDRPVVLEGGKTYTLHMTLSDGALVEKVVTTAAGTRTVLEWAGALASVPMNDSVWVLASDTLEPKPYRIVSIAEKEKAVYEVNALEVYVPKYALIDTDVPLDPPKYNQPNELEAPTSLKVKEQFYYKNNVPISEMTFSWMPAASMLYPAFRVEVDTPKGPNEYIDARLTDVTFTVNSNVQGDYTIRVYALGTGSAMSSEAATLTVSADAQTAAPAINVENVSIVGEAGNEFFTRDVEIKWKNTAPEGPAVNLMFLNNEVAVYDNSVPLTPVLLNTYTVVEPTFKYSFNLNKADTLALGREPARYLKFVIRAQDTLLRFGPPTDYAVQNLPLAAPPIKITPTIGLAMFEVTTPTIKDYVGVKVHLSTSAVFTPGPGNLYYDNASGQFSLPLADGSWYAMAGLYDNFSDTVVNYTAAIGFTVLEVNIDLTPPAQPTGLSATSTVIDTGATKVTYTWDANTEDDLAGYDLQISENGGASYISFITSTNLKDITVLPNTPLKAKVRAFDKLGNPGPFTVVYDYTSAKDTVAPAVPAGLNVEGTFNGFWLEWVANVEADFKEYEIYELGAATPAPDAGTAATHKAVGTTMWRGDVPAATAKWFWIRSVDTSGNKSAWSALQTASTLTLSGTQPAPAVPGIPTLTSSLVAVNGGGYVAKVRVTWTAVTNASTYEIGVVRAGATETFLVSGTNSVEFDGIPGVAYTVRIGAIGNVGQRSGFGATAVTTPGGDLTAPAVPTGLTLTPAFEAIWLKWNRNVEDDFAYYEIYEHTAATPAPVTGTTATFTTTSASYPREGLPTGATRWYWLRSVDYSGNKSAWSALATASAASLVSADIAALVDATSFASSIAIPGLGATLPATPFTALTPKTFYLTTTGVLYKQKLDGTGWIAQTDTTLMVGQIVAGQIAANAIGADQISANAITAKHIVLTDTTNLIQNGNFQQGLDGWGRITGNPTVIDDATGPSKTAMVLVRTTSEVSATVGGNFGFADTEPYAIFVNAGEQIYLEAWAHSTVAGSTSIGDLPYRRRDTGVVASFGSLGTVLVANTWTKVSRVIDVTVDAYVYPRVINSLNNSTLQVSDFKVNRRNGAKLIVDGTLTSNMVTTGEFITLSAQIKAATINTAHIISLTADKISVGAMNAGITVGSTGVTIGTVEARANDPATRINSASTKIDPGKITISGATTLADWRGTDTTTIAGGKIETNSIKATSIILGSYSDNLITNGDFLEGLAPWTIFQGAGTTYSYYITGGSRTAVQLHIDRGSVAAGDGLAIRGRTFPVEGSDEYTFSAWYVGGTASAGGFYMRIYWMDEAGGAISSTDVLSNASIGVGWQQAIGTVLAPANARQAYPVFYNWTNSTAKLLAISSVSFRRKVEGSLIVNGTITGAHLTTATAVITGTAQIADAIITTAKIVNLNADKINVGGLNAGITVGVTGVTIGTVEARASNPATRINAVATTIDPGRILISGATTLASWRAAGDTTKIEGGNIYANSINANSLKIGSRGLTVTGFNFRVVSGTLYWDAGWVQYMDTSGVLSGTNVIAGAIGWGGWTGIYFQPGNTSLHYRNDSNGGWNSLAATDTVVNFCTWMGGANLAVTYGGTIIDGTQIVTGTITVTQMGAGSISATQIQANAIAATHLQANIITARHLALTDFNNLVPDNQMMDFTGETWSIANGWAPYPDHNLFPGSYNAWYFNAGPWGSGGYTAVNSSKSFPVKGSAQYRCVGASYSNHAYACLIRIRWFDGNGALITYQDYQVRTGPAGSGENSNVDVTAPSNAKTAGIGLYVNRDSTLGPVYFGGIGVFEKNAASLTVDGSIKGNHLDVNSISAIHINALTITADKLVLNGVDTAQLAVNASTKARVNAYNHNVSFTVSGEVITRTQQAANGSQDAVLINANAKFRQTAGTTFPQEVTFYVEANNGTRLGETTVALTANNVSASANITVMTTIGDGTLYSYWLKAEKSQLGTIFVGRVECSSVLFKKGQ